MSFKNLFENFSNKKILVVGDVMIDSYLLGKVNRMSPEAPVPVVSFENREDRLGGAANVALNLVSLGSQAIICSVIGKDRNGELLNSLLTENGISGAGLVYSNDRQTTVKTRVLGNHQHLLRIDSEQTNAITSHEEEDLIEKYKSLLADGIDAIILEDYNKGVLTVGVISAMIEIANQKGIAITVDPKKENFFAYKNVTLFKPNLKELKEGLGVDFNFAKDKDSFESAIVELEKRLNNKITFITLSEHGVFIKEDNDKAYVNAHLRNISDVSGAGDTVIAVATLCLVSGLSTRNIAEIANIAGGLVCEKSGVVPIDKNELMDEVMMLLTV